VTSPGWPPSTVLRDLAHKYDEIARLREERAAGAPPAGRDVLRGLSARFPGALRELDTMELDEIRARATALRDAATTGVVAPWMAWVAAYHALFRLALGTSGETGAPLGLSAEAVARLRAPAPATRTEAVIRIVAETFGAPEEEVGRALLPRRRRPR
jgi:hypothetical protein